MRRMICNVAIDTEAATSKISDFFRHRIPKYSNGPRGLIFSITTSNYLDYLLVPLSFSAITRAVCNCVYGSGGASCLLAHVSRPDKATDSAIKQMAPHRTRNYNPP